ncbi:hypothetical protein [Paenibacillus pasadenensis]|nr:hypothetical protein [Paenibacillus pasadenensis]
MTERQRFLITQSMALMDGAYDEQARLIRSYEEPERQDTRGSAHYALGLLLRDEGQDRERACAVIGRVLDLQFDYPGEIYHGTFRTSPQAPHPPVGGYPWQRFAPGTAYYLDRTLEAIAGKLAAAEAADPRKMKRLFKSAVSEVLPPVWDSYDPNWREFIASAFAVILSLFEEKLPPDLVRRMDESMARAVQGSIDRRLSDAVPMNTNIELMHIFITHCYGYRLGETGWISHAYAQAESFLERHREFGTFAEFNTTTYYGVDLTVLGLWRRFGRSDRLLQIGRELERGLWENMALYYNANLENLCGPYARAYDMEMQEHSSIGVFVYLLLGEGYEHLTRVNCETCHDVMIALVGVDAPSEVIPYFVSHQGDRMVRKRFVELCERDDPQANTNLCTAKAWIGADRMIGAMSGSRNTNGQLHPATMHWRDERGGRYTMRLLRREAGEGWNAHLRGIAFEVDATPDSLEIDVRLEADVPIDVFFEIRGPALQEAVIEPTRWRLPGLDCRVEADAPKPDVALSEGVAEVSYRYSPSAADGATMKFTLRFD